MQGKSIAVRLVATVDLPAPPLSWMTLIIWVIVLFPHNNVCAYVQACLRAIVREHKRIIRAHAHVYLRTAPSPGSASFSVDSKLT